MISFERRENVFVLDLGDGDNRFDLDSLDALERALDEVAAATGPAALVTSASGKIWSNGLDLELLATLGDGFIEYVGRVEDIFARYLRLPVPTVAAVQGHAFAGGAMLALAHDERVMRSDRGYVCLPEVDLGMPFSPGMAALIAGKVSQPALHRLAVLGERIAGPEAESLGIVDVTVPDDQVLDEALRRAEVLAAKATPTLAALRGIFYRDALAALGNHHP